MGIQHCMLPIFKLASEKPSPLFEQGFPIAWYENPSLVER